MSVKLRLRRMGKKKQPFYRIVAIDSRSARNGRYIENIGTYDPLKNPVELNIKEDRVLYWLGEGAIPSFTVKSFFKKQGILFKWHLMKQGADDAAISEEMKKWEAQQFQRQKRLDALAEQKARESKKAKNAKEEAEAKAAADSSTDEEASTETKAAEPVTEQAKDAVESTTDAGESQEPQKTSESGDSSKTLESEQAEPTETEKSDVDNVEAITEETKTEETQKADAESGETPEVDAEEKTDDSATEEQNEDKKK